METKEDIIRDILGECKFANRELLFYCPKCDHHNMKLSVNLNKNVFKCWICDFKGLDIYSLVSRYGNSNHRDKWREICGEVEVTDFDNLFKEVVERDEVIELPEYYQFLGNKNLHKSALKAIKYLAERGLKREDLFRWKIGYCNNGKYKGRIIFPSFNKEGDLNYFVSRTYTKDWPPYDNPKIKRTEIIFGENMIDWNEDITIVEGVFDAVVAGSNSVPLLGSTLKEEHRLFNKIVKHNSKVYIALDADAEIKAMKLIWLLIAYGIEVWKITLNKGDLGDLTKDKYQEFKDNAKKIDNDNYMEMRMSS